nr:putative disease resistance RPP13-like protein 1 [Quercus suber]
MGYGWNPVREDIKGLKSLFHSLYKTFREQKIDDELQKKSMESEKLLMVLDLIVANTQYKIYNVEMQKEGGALDDKEKQHERSVLEVKNHERIVLELWLEGLEDAVFNTEDLVDKIHTEALRHKLDGQIFKEMEDIRCSLESYAKAGYLLGLDAVSTYRMEPLSEERSWSIFAKSAFGDQNPTPDAQLEVIGKEIVQMCHGLPSSVRILGLPEDLKRCLAYCSIFPPDYEFDMEKLVLLCMAEGFLKRKTMKEASRSIDGLKSFFQKSSRNESSFRMCGKYENSVIFVAIDRAKLLRTFSPLDHESRHLCATELQNLLSKLQFLRVLSLSHYHITEIPDSIGNLEHLRYIDLSYTPIKRLPESVCELCNLQSLILSNCHSLTELPENTSNLENLLNLDVSGSGLSEMPIGMSKLKNLKLLPCFVVGKKSGCLIELRNITRLEGTLHILKLQNVTSENDAGGAPLVEMYHLKGLVLEWDDNTADPENARKVLAGLKPYPTLERLTINFYCGTKFPEWLGGTWWLNKIVFVRLSNCQNCSTLPALGKLPNLRVLIIECMDAVEEVGPEFSAEKYTKGISTFIWLERLTFEGMSKWTKWVPLVEFPSLKQLCIRRCPKLRGNLPKLLPSVERVEISESQELVTALTTEQSLKNLRYRDRIVSSSDGKETYFKSERATGSSSLIIGGQDIEKLKESEESEEIDVEIQNPFGEDIEKLKETEGSEEIDVEIQNPFEFPFLEETPGF